MHHLFVYVQGEKVKLLQYFGLKNPNVKVWSECVEEAMTLVHSESLNKCVKPADGCLCFGVFFWHLVKTTGTMKTKMDGTVFFPSACICKWSDWQKIYSSNMTTISNSARAVKAAHNGTQWIMDSPPRTFQTSVLSRQLRCFYREDNKRQLDVFFFFCLFFTQSSYRTTFRMLQEQFRLK